MSAKSWVECPACDGNGGEWDEGGYEYTPCSRCGGVGEIEEPSCPYCGGEGSVEVPDQARGDLVTIPCGECARRQEPYLPG